jgi:hypothetical protein
MNETNPYQSSQVAADLPARPTGESLDSIARRTFLAWEKLRLLFNAILIAVSLSAAGLVGVVAKPDFWLAAVGGGVVLNLCYFAGPIVESYVAWLGFPTRWPRVATFVLGTLACGVAALVAVAAVGFWAKRESLAK